MLSFWSCLRACAALRARLESEWRRGYSGLKSARSDGLDARFRRAAQLKLYVIYVSCGTMQKCLAARARPFAL